MRNRRFYLVEFISITTSTPLNPFPLIIPQVNVPAQCRWVCHLSKLGSFVVRICCRLSLNEFITTHIRGFVARSATSGHPLVIPILTQTYGNYPLNHSNGSPGGTELTSAALAELYLKQIL